MNIPKPKPFHLPKSSKSKIKRVRAAGVNTYVVVEYQFPALKQDVSIFHNAAEAVRMVNRYNRESDAYTSYSVEKRTLR